MSLRDLVRKPVPVRVATATVATVATIGVEIRSTVATVASVAVANALEPSAHVLPADWRDGLARLRHGPPPPGYGEAAWARLADEAARLGEQWGGRAVAAGWGALDLFGCSPGFARRLDRDGLAMLLDGRPVLALNSGTATIGNRTGAPNVYRRRVKPGAVLMWEGRE